MRVRVVACAAWLFVATGISASAGGRIVKATGEGLDVMPAALGAWRSADSDYTASQDLIEAKVRPMCDDALSRTYSDGEGHRAEVQIFYCNARRPKNRLVYYLDSVQCLQGHYPTATIAVVELAPGLSATRMRLRREDARATVLYWLESQGRASAGYMEHALWLDWMDLAGRRTDGCFVKVAYYGPSDPAADAAASQLSHSIAVEIRRWLDARGEVRE